MSVGSPKAFLPDAGNEGDKEKKRGKKKKRKKKEGKNILCRLPHERKRRRRRREFQHLTNSFHTRHDRLLTDNVILQNRIKEEKTR